MRCWSRDAAASALLAGSLLECFPARVELRGLLPEFLALSGHGFGLLLQLTFLLIEFVPILGEGLAVLLERGLQPLVISALLIHAGAGFGQLCGFLLQFLHARGQLFRLFVESGCRAVPRRIAGRTAPLRARGETWHRRRRPAAAARTPRQLPRARRCGNRARAHLVGFGQSLFEFAGAGFQSFRVLLEIRLAAFEFPLLFGQLALPARQILAALIELLHALSQFLEQDFLPPTGCRLPLFPLPLPLVELLPPLREFAGLLLQLVGLTRQVEIAAFDVRDVLLQLVRHLPELFGQGPLNLLDPVTLRLQ